MYIRFGKLSNDMDARGVVTGVCLECDRDACWTCRHCCCPIVRRDISTKEEN